MTAHETLGVELGASKQAIKKAYRKKAKTMHPDAGGDNKAFDQLRIAYDDLMGEKPPPSQAINIVMNLYCEMIANGEREEVVYRNIEKEITDRIYATIQNLFSQLTNARKRIKTFNRINKRLREDSIVRRHNDLQIASNENAISQIEFAIKDHQIAVEMVGKIGFTPEEKPEQPQPTGQVMKVFQYFINTGA